MKCYNCGQVLPEDSEFCQYCGNKIENEVVNPIEIKEETLIVKSPIVEIEKTKHRSIKKTKEKKIKVRFCKFCGSQIDDHTKKCSGCGKQYFKGIKFNKFLIAIIVLFAVILTSVIINIVQFVEIENLTDKVDSQTSTISSLDEKSDYYDMICRELSYGNIGYAANNFRASESIIVVDKNETNRKFTLTANWPNNGNVSVAYSGSSAKVSFDNNSWGTSTKMTIKPKTEGVTVVKFSNNVDSKTFKIIIIVTN